MESKGLLPDTCAWIGYFRQGSTPLAQSLDASLTTDAVYCCGPVLYELVQGARSERDEETLLRVLNALPFLDMTPAIWIKAGQLSSSLRKTGKTVPFSDILIASLAMEHNLTVLTDDDHFFAIPGVSVKSADI